jgi:hypothetical protein
MTPSDLMAQVETECDNVPVGSPSWALFNKFHRDEARLQPWRATWRSGKATFGEEFSDLLSFPGIKTFYNAFQAEAYVVSANSVYRHPSSPTLIGLASAVKAQNCQATLHLTEAETLSTSDLTTMCKRLGADAETLFGGHYLSVWFLDSDNANCYFTLNGGAHVTGSREQTGRVNQVQFSRNMIVDDDDLTNQLESDKVVIPSRQTLENADRQFYNILTTVYHTNHYLDVSTAVPQTTTSTATTFIIYGVTDPNPPVSLAAGTKVGQIQVGQEKPHGPGYDWQLFKLGSSTTLLGNGAFQLFWTLPGTTEL